MAVRKPVNDPEAHLAANDLFRDFIAEARLTDSPVAAELGEQLTAEFRTAEFEWTAAKVAGEVVTMRRLVLTGEWEVTDTASA